MPLFSHGALSQFNLVLSQGAVIYIYTKYNIKNTSIIKYPTYIKNVM